MGPTRTPRAPLWRAAQLLVLVLLGALLAAAARPGTPPQRPAPGPSAVDPQPVPAAPASTRRATSVPPAGPGGLDTFTTPSGAAMAGLHAWDPDSVGYRVGGRRSLRIGHLDLTGAIPTFRRHDGSTG